jgi:dTDP-4-amino-4,6-dideoxygalactose transaminase
MTGSSRYVPFNRAPFAGSELEYIRQAVERAHLASGGPFTARCTEWLRERTGAKAALLTTSCTDALEIAMLLLDLRPGDEVVMPSFTFVSTANAVALRGATPVFVDIRPDTLNIDERLVEEAVTERTRAIVAVHYAGVACAMDALRETAERHALVLVEDAAHALLASVDGRPLGALGDLGAVSFHETKNLTSGEGGALLVNDARWTERAEIALEKGTNRREFFRGRTEKYTWVDLGSSHAASEINAAFLCAQLDEADAITARRRRIWQTYYDAFEELEARELLRRPVVPPGSEHNAHLFYVLVRDGARDAVLDGLAERGVNAVFHFVPLHDSPAGARYGRVASALPVTEDAARRLIRLPLWADMSDEDVEHVISSVGAVVA